MIRLIPFHKKNIKIFYKTKKELDNYCRNENILHQGFVAEVEKLERVELVESSDVTILI